MEVPRRFENSFICNLNIKIIKKKYIKKDSSGHVFAKLLSGIFPVSEAAKLRLEDWVDEKLTRVSLKVGELLLYDRTNILSTPTIKRQSDYRLCPKRKVKNAHGAKKIFFIWSKKNK